MYKQYPISESSRDWIVRINKNVNLLHREWYFWMYAQVSFSVDMIAEYQ